jgi:hypothetical protein
MANIKYIGVFFDSNDLPKGKLEKDVLDKHITLKYHPTTIEVEMFKNLLGKEVTVSIIGYGNDGNNEGFFVEILTKNIPYLGADRPHITLSVSAVGNAVNTAFVPLSAAAYGKVTGRIGFFANDGKILFK